MRIAGGSRQPRIAVITYNQIPRVNLTLKYERLGRMAIANRKAYCDRHGYTLIHDVPMPQDRPACWAKIPAILEAFDHHDWVLCADSDALVFNAERPIEEFFRQGADLIVQSHDEFFARLGLDPERGYQMIPISTGVFLMRSSDWSREFLSLSWQQTRYVTEGEVWDGIGEQEAMASILAEHPKFQSGVRYVEGLQNHPKFYRPDDLFVHFYGNHARHLIPTDAADRVIRDWEEAIAEGRPFPEDIRHFHWCCIQHMDPGNPSRGGDPSRFFYGVEDIVPGGHWRHATASGNFV
jgi:hypothetical protein